MALAAKVLGQAMINDLRSIYFEPLGPFPCQEHKALVDALAAYGTSKMVFIPDHPVKFSQSIRQEAENFQPQLIIFGYFGDRIPLEDIAYLREHCPDAFLVQYIADAAIFNEKLYQICLASDFTIVASPSYFPDLARRGLAAGSFPGWTQTQYLHVKRELTADSPDVVFIGALYPDTSFPDVWFRRESVQAMAQSGIGFEVYGPGWAKAGVRSMGSTYGQYSRNAAIYARAKIGLSVDDVRDKYCCCSDRPYNIAATGCMVLTATFPGMEWNGWVDGQTCAAFDTTEEMVDKARYYLAHEVEREAIGQAGRKLVHERHVWPARIEALWAMLEGIHGGQT